MCTVTYIKYNDQYFFTSNRDENINRQSAFYPQKYVNENFNLYYPEDPVGRGTWFCVRNNGAICILLNGAQKNHVSNGPYLKSRGIVLLELIKNQNILLGWEEVNLEKTEPFTVIAFSNGTLSQLRWNGTEKESIELNAEEAYIWSSATLYSDDIMAQRKIWFEAFLKDNDFTIDGNKILAFHTDTQKENTENGLQIRRINNILTKNITQCVLRKNDFTITHLDLLTGKKTIIEDEVVVV
jgi:uncharacterized protein with NRDE domain